MSSSDQSSQPRKNQGRRKANIAKIENVRNLQVTFSKRRVGLFKKASELCTLTGAEAGLVVFSPGNKAHSFGHPDINTIADRFLALKSTSANVTNRYVHVQQSSVPTGNHDMEYLARIEKQLEVEKAKMEELDHMSFTIGELNYQQLEVLRGKIMVFAKNLKAKVEDEAVKPPMMPYGVVPDGTYAENGGGFRFVAHQHSPGFFVSSNDSMVKYGMAHGDGADLMIPYDDDQGATGTGEVDTSHQFKT